MADSGDQDSDESERAHAFKGDATQPWFEGRRGGEGRRRIFEVLVDGQEVATETLGYHPTELLDTEYTLPEALRRGRHRVTVTFQPHPDAATAANFEIRMVPRAR